MLDFWKIHTTSFNMKLESPIVGLLLVGLLVPYSVADISLKLKKKSYIPPHIEQHPQETFHEDKYANSRYQIFEVHNHYEPPAGTGLNVPKSQVNNGYSPPQQHDEKIHIQHINAPVDFPFDDPNLDASYLSLDSNNQKFILKHETRATAFNNNPSKSASLQFQHQFSASPKAAEYFQTSKSIKSRHKVKAAAFHDQPQQFINNFKGSDYLPPHNNQQQNQNSFVGNQQQTSQQIVPNATKTQVTERKHVQNVLANSSKGNTYLPPLSGNNKMSNFKRPGYSPPPQGHPVQEQQISFGQKTPFKGPDYLPPHHQGSLNSQPTTFGQNVQFKGSYYLPPNQDGHHQQQQTTSQFNNNFRRPDFLPPHKNGHIQQNLFFKGPDYLPPQSYGSIQKQTTSFKQNAFFKGPDYLPPQQDNSVPQQSRSLQQSIAYKGLDYLPPHEKQQQPQYQNANSNIKTLSYSPPDYDFQKPTNSEQAIAELHTLPEQPQQQYKQEVTVGAQIQVTGHEKSNDIVYGSQNMANPPHSVSSHKKAGYLPPGYDFRNPENFQPAINQLHSQEPQQQSQIPSSEESITQLHCHDSVAPKHFQESNPIKATQYLPTGYDFQKPENSEQAINQLHSIDTQIHQSSHSSPSENIGGQSYNAPGYLPPGYEFQKPDDTQPTTKKLQSQSHQTSSIVKQNHNQNHQSYGQYEQQPQSYNPAQVTQHNVQQIGQIFKGSDYLPPVASVTSSNQEVNQPTAPTFKGPDYLPPVASAQRESAGYRAPDYLPPVAQAHHHNTSQQTNELLVSAFKGPDYQANNQQAPQQSQLKVKPTVASQSRPIHATNVYPLRSYMTSVKPYERYGSARRPISEYGLPLTMKSMVESTVFANNDVSSLYHEPASRPKYYAPTMSYEKNAVNIQNQYQGNQQTRQSAALTSSSGSVATTTLQTAKRASARIRTVQIINATAVKTLKVLESLDHSGVKTIKILGPSHEEPMGDYRVVKVLSAHGQGEQTVKIFNDQQDVTASFAQSHITSSQSYLPPIYKRKSNNKPKAKVRRRI